MTTLNQETLEVEMTDAELSAEINQLIGKLDAVMTMLKAHDDRMTELYNSIKGEQK